MSYDLTDDEKDKIDKAYAAIMAAFGRYKQTLEVNDVMMQPGLLLCAVTSWILDEERHAAFHPCNNIKRYKRASYFAYWFTRIKPIQVLSADRQPRTHMVLINEKFAIFIVYSLLGISGRGVVPSDFSEEMLYVLRYRDSSPESLFTTMNLLEISAQSGELRKAYTKKQTVAT